jgi:hypothetical protein
MDRSPTVKRSFLWDMDLVQTSALLVRFGDGTERTKLSAQPSVHNLTFRFCGRVLVTLHGSAERGGVR